MQKNWLMARDPHEVSRLLRAWSNGEPAALERLTPLIYDELRRQARQFLDHERADHTLQTTALVHEVYLRLAEERRVSWESRAHFFGSAARLMRRVLVEHARSRGAAKRGGGAVRVTLGEALVPVTPPDVDLLSLDGALTRLSAMDPRQGRIVELRFFAGLSIGETAEVLGVGPATVSREWRTARAWLLRELTRGRQRPTATAPLRRRNQEGAAGGAS